MTKIRFCLLAPIVCSLLLSTLSPQGLPPVPVPVENPITEEKRVLGKILFWEEQLSSDDTVACGTCHIMSAAGSDPRLGAHPGPDGVLGNADDVVGSPGILRSDSNNDYVPSDLFGFAPQVTGRNSPPVVGSQWAPELFWDGRAGGTFLNPDDGTVSIASGGALENQIVGPPVSVVEMAHEARSWSEITTKLAVVTPLRLATDIPPDMANALLGPRTYPDLFEDAFGTADITAERIAFAIATYERTLVPDQSPYDLFLAGDPNAMTAQQQSGLTLLADHTVCFNCHVPPLFTDNEFHNIGLRPAGEDIGRQGVSGDPNDFGRFKTPTLRNVKLRSSQMHVGWITDTQDAIDFYNANNLATGHTQFPENQSGIPTGMPGVFADYGNILMPEFFHPAVIEFLENGLLDPRLENEVFPFDRPTLRSELSPPNPELYGRSSGAIRPAAIARSPLHDLAPDFKVGITGAESPAVALLAISLSPAPGLTFLPIDLHVDVTAPELQSMMAVSISGSGVDGYATLHIPIDTGVQGMHFYGQWFVFNGVPGELAASEGIHWTGL